MDGSHPDPDPRAPADASVIRDSGDDAASLRADLARTVLFHNLNDALLQRLIPAIDTVHIEPHRYVYHEDELPDTLYVVGSGQLTVFRDAIGQPLQLLARLVPGDHFGEIGLFDDTPREASVRATTACRLRCIHRDDLLPLLEQVPHLRARLRSIAAQRHSANVAASLELSRRREVRIRTHSQVPMHLKDGPVRTITIENLSLGGVCLRGAPDAWRPGAAVVFGLELSNGVLWLHGRVVWRLDAALGVQFIERAANHDTLIQMAIRLLLEQSMD
ncbi:MAG: cyclic nucleotide-binding domain-containing protein [Acidobacteriota bacterium]